MDRGCGNCRQKCKPDFSKGEIFCTDGFCKAYDLSCHTQATGIPLVVRETRKEPLIITEYVVETNKAKFGPRFKQDGKAVQSTIDRLTQDIKEKLSLELKENGKIVIDVPGVGDSKVELPSGTKHAPMNVLAQY